MLPESARRGGQILSVVDPAGAICRCGNRGCLETVAGAAAVLDALRGTYGGDISIRDVVARAIDGDAGCARAIAAAGRAIGSAAANLCNPVNPARIVVGGDLGTAGDLLLEPLRESLRRGAIRSAASEVSVVCATLGERTGARRSRAGPAQRGEPRRSAAVRRRDVAAVRFAAQRGGRRGYGADSIRSARNTSRSAARQTDPETRTRKLQRTACPTLAASRSAAPRSQQSRDRGR
jgi:predicted NBD/HSP70 family sugar kinase